MSDPAPPTSARRPPMKERLKALFAEYGSIAIAVFLVIWVLTLGGIWLAVRFGWKPESAAGDAGTFGAAYVAFRFTLPIRIAVTAALTPFVAKLYERVRGKRPPRQIADAGTDPKPTDAGPR